MYYKTGYFFTARDLFKGGDYKKLGIKAKVFYNIYHCKCLEDFLMGVFLFYMYIVVLDMIVNNTTFVLPLTGNRGARINIKTFDGEDFQRMYAGGKFIGIDFLSSLFRGYQIYFTYNYRGGIREKPIYINRELKELFYSYINSGKEYY